VLRSNTDRICSELDVELPALTMLSWTLVIYYGQRERTPETKTGFPTKQACEQAAAKYQTDFERQVKEGTIRTEPDLGRRMPRSVPSTKCVENAQIPP
jgi:hypothetical protein